MSSPTSKTLARPIPLGLIVLCALAFHGPLLLMRLPAHTFDANFHMSMASHYAHHWFDPWNEKSLAGFSQTTYPPLTHQWIAIASHLVGLDYGFMLVLGAAILMLPVAVYRFSRLWVSERAASYGAFCSVFLGSLCLLSYQDGQIGTVSSTTLFLLALPYAYQYVLKGNRNDLILGLALSCTAAAAHHATLLFGMVFFVPPVLWLLVQDFRGANPGASLAVPLKRTILFVGSALAGILLVLLPYVLSFLKNPIKQTPIPHLSRANFLLEPHWGLHYWLVPFGAVVLALPYIFYKGRERRLRPLLIGFYFALIFGLGGTTPLPRWVLGRAFEILTFERFTFWALLLAMPFVGLLAVQVIDRFKVRGAAALVVAVVASGALAVAWNIYFPLIGPALNVDPVIKFLNENGHDRYRYLTLGFSNALSKVACYTNASSVDGEYNSGRSLPEMTLYGSAQLSSAKFYGTEGMLSLSAMLKHAPRYGLRYIFVHDAYYEPLLTFSGWHQIESFNHGDITVWTTTGIPFATSIPSPLRPPQWQGIIWGTLPVGASIVTIFLALMRVRESRSRQLPIDAGDERLHRPEPAPDALSQPSGLLPSIK
ncbi:MAG TPA: hypothetical protein VI386_14650 [Candidatus Sulfotelmatobacter sp.]